MKKMTRHQMRENAMMLIFEKSFCSDSPEDILAVAEETDALRVDDSVKKMFLGTCEHLSEVDAVIEKNLKNWKMNRISKLCLAVLRIGVYEVLFCDDVENDIVVSECVKLATDFAYDDEVSFVNGVMGSVVKGISD